MRVDDAQAAFDAFVKATGAHLDHCTAEEAVELMLAWYQTERADDVELNEDGDMLLYQWGTYDWGDGPSFRFDEVEEGCAASYSDQRQWRSLESVPLSESK